MTKINDILEQLKEKAQKKPKVVRETQNPDEKLELGDGSESSN